MLNSTRLGNFLFFHFLFLYLFLFVLAVVVMRVVLNYLLRSLMKYRDRSGFMYDVVLEGDGSRTAVDVQHFSGRRHFIQDGVVEVVFTENFFSRRLADDLVVDSAA